MVNGTVSFSQQGNTLAITNTPNAIINWQSFSINGNETTRFVQQSAASSVLNRVTGIDPSIILGTLLSNGRVFLINPSGIIFGQGSRVDVAGLVASTLDTANRDFMAGNATFSGNSTASIVNQGHLHARPGGYVAFLGQTVSNQGIISAKLGTVAMASGNKVTLHFDGNSLIDVTVDEGTLNALRAGRVALIQHDNLLYIHDFVAHDGVRVMEMEWVDGYDLRQVLTPEMLQRCQERLHPDHWRYVNDVILTSGPVQPRLGILGFMLDRAIVQCSRGGAVAGIAQHVGQVGQSGRIIGIDRQRGAVMPDGGFVFALFTQGRSHG